VQPTCTGLAHVVVNKERKLLMGEKMFVMLAVGGTVRVW
jgi:hypothetical protein